MADTLYEYFAGSPEQRAEDMAYQQRQFDAAMSSPRGRALRGLAYTGAGELDYDPRQAMLDLETPDGGAVRDTLHPRVSTDAVIHGEAAINYAMAMGQRARDTALRGVQEAVAGNPRAAAGYAAKALPSALYPPLAAGTPGSPDDWRENARRNGVPAAHILMFDYATDPESWITAPVGGPAAFVLPAIPMRLAGAARKASRIDDALGAMRYGRGIRAELVDRHGETIRRLRSATRSPPPSQMLLPSPSY